MLKNIFSNKSTWIIIGVIILIIWIFKIKQPEKILIDTSFNKVENYKDINGKEHQLIKTQQVSPEQMKSIVDSIASSLKKKNVQVITQVIMKTDTVFRNVPVAYNEGNNTFKIEKKDNYIDLTVEGNKQEATISLKTIDSLTYALTTEKHLFKADIIRADISNTNPYNKVQAGRSFQIRQQKTLISIGPQIGYNPFTQKVTVGIGVTLPLINIKSK